MKIENNESYKVSNKYINLLKTFFLEIIILPIFIPLIIFILMSPGPKFMLVILVIPFTFIFLFAIISYAIYLKLVWVEYHISPVIFEAYVDKTRFLGINWNDVNEIVIIKRAYVIHGSKGRYYHHEGYQLQIFLSEKSYSIKLWYFETGFKKQNLIINKIEDFCYSKHINIKKLENIDEKIVYPRHDPNKSIDNKSAFITSESIGNHVSE